MTHQRGVDEPAITPDRADTARLGAAVVGDDRVCLGDLRGRRGEHLVGDGHLVGVDGPLAVEAEQAGVRRGAPVAVEILVAGVRRVDRVDPAARAAASTCTRTACQKSPG